MMRQYVYENLPLSAVKDHFDAIESSGYSVSLFTDWQKQRINEVWIKSRVEEGQAFDATPEFFGAKRATRNLHPIAELSAEMNGCRTFAWASHLARAKSCKRSTLCPASMRSKQFWQLNDCAIKSVHT